MDSSDSTKNLILCKSIELISEHGYAAVSMRDIARACGIKSPSIYNHYAGKEDILASIYRLYQDNVNALRRPLEEIEDALHTCSSEDVIHFFNYGIPVLYGEPSLLFNVVRIVWGRIYIDTAASELYRSDVLNGGLAYISAILSRLVALGRLSMTEEEMNTFAGIVLSCRIFAANAAVADPNQEKWRITETGMLKMAARLLALRPMPPA